MIARLLISLLVPWALGFGLVRLAWPNQPASWAARLLVISLAAPLGFGVVSCLFFLWLLLPGLSIGGFAITEAVAAAALLGWGALVGSGRMKSIRTAGGSAPAQPDAPIARLRPLIVAACAAICIVGLGALAYDCFSGPHGGYDAWAIWNLHARFLARGGEHWRELFSLANSSHPDYPLLLPALVARSWLLAGAETTAAPQLLAVIFTLACVGILVSTIALVRNNFHASLAAAFLLGASHFVYNAVSQAADIPLSVFVLAALALVCLQAHFPHDSAGLAALAGALAALAAWTKNEGLLFFVALSSANAAVMLLGRQRLSWRRQILPFAIGALPILLLVAYFKGYLAPPSELVGGQSRAMMIARLTDPARYWLVVRAYITWFAIFGRGSIVALALYALCAGRQRGASDNAGATVLTLALMLLGYGFVFVTTLYDLAWHLSSLERLLMQLWPSILLAVVPLTATPGWAHAQAKFKAAA
jgi:hypothetical protein